MNRQRERALDRLYDVALDEVVGERSVASDMVDRVKFGLMMGPRAELTEDLTLPRRFWMAPFVTAAAAALVFVAIGVVYFGSIGDRVDQSPRSGDGNLAASEDREVSGASEVEPYAQVRSVQDVALLGNDVRSIQCDGVGLREVGEIVKRGFVSLERLSFVRCGFDDSAMSEIASLENLTHVEFVECDEITDPGLLHLSALPEIEKLTLTRCAKITNGGVTALQIQRPRLVIDIAYPGEPDSSDENE